MARFRLSMLLPGLLLCYSTTWGQSAEAASSADSIAATSSAQQVSAVRSFKAVPRARDFRVTVSPAGGPLSFGIPVSTHGETLRVYTGTAERSFPAAILRSVTVERSGARSALPLEVAAGGFYAGVLLAGTSEGTGPFLTTELDAWLILLCGLGGAVLAGGATYIGEKGVTTGEDFYFPDDPAARREEWNRLVEYLYGVEEAGNMLSVSIHAAFVPPRAGKRQSPYGYYSYDYVTNFSLFRSARVAYSLSRPLDVGVALISLDESPPPPFGYPVDTLGVERTEGMGYYAEVIAKPFHASLPRSLSLRLGVGIGAASVEYGYYRSSMYALQQPVTTIDRWSFSAVAHANAILKTSDRFGLGVMVDYVFVGGGDRPAVPALGLEEKPFGGGSLGFTLTYFF